MNTHTLFLSDVYDTVVQGFAHLEVAMQKLVLNHVAWQLSLWSEEFKCKRYLVTAGHCARKYSKLLTNGFL